MSVPTVSTFTPYSTLLGAGIFGEPPTWWPQEAADRIASYFKYDEIYWNDPTAYILRVLEGEQPIYVPNARTVVDTTSHYLLKGLKVSCKNDKKTDGALQSFLDRELFYSRFHTAKVSGVARGDWAMHLTAEPTKSEGTRLSLTELDPAMVMPVWNEEDPDKMDRVHIVDQWIDDRDKKVRLKKLTYWLEGEGDQRRVWREEGIYELEPKWYGPNPRLYKQTLPKAALPEGITAIPVYWFKNLDWMGQKFGSSELRGFESLLKSVSQQTTDQGSSLSLEGLGVYSTDSGRPVDDDGKETDWEIAPGKVMEVVQGSYFRRVEGVGTLKPSLDHIGYLESKIREAGGLSDVALGRVDVQTAQSGIALAIKFMPTLAKIEQRDLHGLGKLKQLFYDWKAWYQAYEGEELTGDIVPEIGQKLPADRTATINELNNMLDRGVISREYYRGEMAKLGYIFPDDIAAQIEAEKTKDAELTAKNAPPGLQDNAQAAASGEMPPPPQSSGGAQNAPRDVGANRSNNKNRTNESAGTESGQTLGRQARGGTPRNGRQR